MVLVVITHSLSPTLSPTLSPSFAHSLSHASHMNPPRHPKLRNLLRLVHQPHIQQKLSSAPNSALEGAENPRVRVGSVFAD